MNGYRGTEEEYRELESLSLKLGIPVPMVFLSRKIELNGEVVKEVSGRSHTWNRNFWNAVYTTITGAPKTSATFGAGYLCNKEVAGTLVIPHVWHLGDVTSGQWLAGLGVNTGIVVGTGTGAESFEDYALGAKVAHGTGAGQLSHAAMPVISAAYVAGTKVWTTTLSRVFNNNSGGTIVIGEIGIYSNSPDDCMVNRDLLGATDTLLNGAQYTVTYSITLTFPA